MRNNPDAQVQTIPWSLGGCYTYKFQSVTGTNANVVKSTRGQLYGYTIFNNLNSEARICFHNNQAPAIGANIKASFVLFKQQPQLFSFPVGIEFDTAISFTLAMGFLDSTLTQATAGNITGVIFYR